jgi:hypothetical protein
MFKDRVNKLDREEIQLILEAEGCEVYEEESTEYLRSALQENINDGTIDASCLDGIA